MQMRVHVLLCIVVAASLLVEVGASARDRKRKKQQKAEDSQQEEQEMKAGAGFSDDKGKETKDRVVALVDRQGEREKEKKEGKESSEEDDKDEKNNGTTGEIEIPKRLRRAEQPMATLGKAQELNGGERKELLVKPASEHKLRMRRHEHVHEMKRKPEINDDLQMPMAEKLARQPRQRRHDHVHETKRKSEINDGVQIPLSEKPKQTHQTRMRRTAHNGHQHTLRIHDSQANRHRKLKLQLQQRQPKKN